MKEERFNKLFNIFILAGMTVCVILSTAIKMQDEGARTILLVISAFGALMGVASTVLAANGSIWNFLFGLLDVCIYSYILYDSHMPSQFLLHVLYFIPMEFVGFYQWRRRGAGAESKVKPRMMDSKRYLLFSLLFVAVFAASAGISWLSLSHGGTEFTVGKVAMDALATTANIVALVMMAFAYMEQWYLWTVVNIASIILWTVTLLTSPEAGYAIIPVVKYSFYLINGLNGIRVWRKLSA
ncbi:MAG: nicotinamide riboside transporter PnuC [Bacteroidales bacterium]|nr:nicotinamide riboside transporter PnuC [Bacteroidales bacterium]